MHMVFCHGPADYVTEIIIDDKQAWYGANTGGIITIDKPKLFGGDKREGGVSGIIDFEQGRPTQNQNNYLGSKLGYQLLPAFKGVCAFVLNQVYLGLSPYIKKWEAVLSRTYTTKDGAVQWYPSKAGIPNLNTAVTSKPEFIAQLPGLIESYRVNFSEDFDLFVAVSGTKTIYSIIYQSYGFLHYLRCAATGPTTTVNKIVKTIPAVTPDAFSIIFTMNTRGYDDNVIFELQNAAGATLFKLRTSVDYDTDVQRRTHVILGTTGVAGRFTNTIGLDTGNRYKCLVTKTGTNTWRADIIDIVFESPENPAIVTTCTGTNAGFIGEISKIVFYNKSVLGTGSGRTEFDEVVFYSKKFFRPDMNPAHIIRECLTDTRWGMGYSENDIDDDSFRSSADVLFTEQMGMSLLWDKQEALEDFILEIIKHIDAVLFISRVTGKFNLKLLRQDYDIETSLVLNESNVVSVQDYTKRIGNDLTNSVSVKYTNGIDWTAALVEVQDLGQIMMQNATVNTTVEYPGFCNPIVATKAAQRDLKTLSSPLIGCTLIANSAAYNLNIGDVFKFTWPNYDIYGKPMRVTGLTISDGNSMQVRISCTEDSFATGLGNYLVVEDSQWVNVSVKPVPTYFLVYEVPYYELVQAQGQTVANNILSINPLASFVGAAAAESQGSINALLFVDDGDGYDELATLDYSPYSVLTNSIDFTTASALLNSSHDLTDVQPGTHAQINDELVLILTCDPLFNTITFGRGCLDTVPTQHAGGSTIVFWDAESIADSTEYNESEVVNVKVCPVTGLGALDISLATPIIKTLKARAIRPYPPGQVQLAGEYYPVTVLAQPFNVTWAHRDRLQQTSTSLIDFMAGNVGPEAGTTYTIKVLDLEFNILATYTGISGTTQAISGITLIGMGYIELYSVRNSYDSYQKHRIPVRFTEGDILLTENNTYVQIESGLYFEEE